jgi:cytochrome c peroxidase
MNKIILLLSFFIILSAEPITPLNTVQVDPRKVELGKALFSDTILSIDNTVSCATCHDLANGGDDGMKFAFGVKGQEGDINSPTVYNAVFNFRQFWNGRAKDLADQATGPIENPIEMGNNFDNLIKTLKKTPYKEKFREIYPDGITKQNIADAIAEFEKTLITLNSPFDRYLLGDENAISEDTKDGYKLFKDKGCIACHHGVNVGGNLYNKFGVMQSVDSKRLGRYEVTGKEQDKYYFKVPSLRNIDKTAPYFHDGRYDNLKDVVKFMSRYQLGRKLSEKEIDHIVLFLKSLSGELPQSVK